VKLKKKKLHSNVEGSCAIPLFTSAHVKSEIRKRYSVTMGIRSTWSAVVTQVARRMIKVDMTAQRDEIDRTGTDARGGRGN